MTFKEKDFDKCFENPLSKDFYTNSVTLQNIAPMSEMMAYIIMMYDPKSPLRKEYVEYGDRKEAAKKITGFDPDDYDTAPESDRLSLADCIVDYLKHIKNRLWTQFVAMEVVHWELVTKLIKPVVVVGSGADKDRLAAVKLKPEVAAQLVALNETMDIIWDKIFDGDVEIKKAAEKRTGGTYSAEAMSQKLKNLQSNIPDVSED